MNTVPPAGSHDTPTLGVEIPMMRTRPKLVPGPPPTHSRWRICLDPGRIRPSPEPPVLPK